jgi:predicted nicotinamide N-methyase
VASTLASHVTVTDCINCVLSNAHKNIIINYPTLIQLRAAMGITGPPNICVSHLNFTECAQLNATQTSLSPKYDVILSSEVIYEEEHPHLLIDVLKCHLNPNGLFVTLCGSDRPGVTQIIELLKNANYFVTVMNVTDENLNQICYLDPFLTNLENHILILARHFYE